MLLSTVSLSLSFFSSIKSIIAIVMFSIHLFIRKVISKSKENDDWSIIVRYWQVKSITKHDYKFNKYDLSVVW